MTRERCAVTRVTPRPPTHPEPSTATSRLWYRAPLRDAPIAASQLPMISDYFAEALGIAGWPVGACLFVSGPDTAEPAAIFFSPAAIAVVPHLIAACGAEPSPPPDRAGAALLVGKHSDWSLLLHEHH